MPIDSEARPQVILGVDPGSRVAGYALLESCGGTPRDPGDFRILDAGVVRAETSQTLPKRIGLLHEAVYDLIRLHKVAVMVLEKAFYDKNVATSIKLGEVRGAFIAAAGRAGIEVTEVAPARVKRLVAGNGQASKEAVSLAIKSLTGFDRGSFPHDVTDALAIAFTFGMTASPTISDVPLAHHGADGRDL